MRKWLFGASQQPGLSNRRLLEGMPLTGGADPTGGASAGSGWTHTARRRVSRGGNDARRDPGSPGLLHQTSPLNSADENVSAFSFSRTTRCVTSSKPVTRPPGSKQHLQWSAVATGRPRDWSREWAHDKPSKRARHETGAGARRLGPISPISA